jgi:AmmeMemoRadiSam system protein B
MYDWGMADTLPRLRMDLDLMPSPVQDRPGLLMRDPYHYSDAALIVPPILVQCLYLFDGQSSETDLRAQLLELTGDLRVGEIIAGLRKSLSDAGFLDDETYAAMKGRRHEAFAAAPVREPLLAGEGYPGTRDELAAMLAGWLPKEPPPSNGLVAIAAPHASLEPASACYGDAYGSLAPDLRDRTFIILGTSHYGEPERFGLTRKPFVTPLGETRTDVALVDELERAGGSAVKMEDYCHAVEHSIEFQVLFLQQVFGADARIVPILCGPFARSIHEGGKPEDDDNVRRFLAGLREIAAREASRLFWVLGIDMAHMGRRYGDPFEAQSGEPGMEEVAEADRRRIGHLESGDAQGFWSAIQENRDSLKWCGSSPLYTFLSAVPQARGKLLRYGQWNIDDASAVTFGAMEFSR